MTPTQACIRLIIDIYKLCGWIILLGIIIPLTILAFVAAHLLVYWILFVDHTSWIVNNNWMIGIWMIWWLIRGTITITLVVLAWKQLRNFPQIKYFKDLRKILSRGFGWLYLAVVIFTCAYIFKYTAMGDIQTPYYLYYVQWFHQIFG
jgi:hypothetical protein